MCFYKFCSRYTPSFDASLNNATNVSYVKLIVQDSQTSLKGYYYTAPQKFFQLLQKVALIVLSHFDLFFYLVVYIN